MVKAFRNFFLLIAVILSIFTMLSCKKDSGTTIYNVYSIDFYVNNQFYKNSHVFEGETVTKPDDPVLSKYSLESHVFLYWTYGGSEYNFSNPVDHSFRLDAFIEEPALLDIFANKADTLEKTSLEIIENSLFKESIYINSNESKYCRYFYLHNSENFDVKFDFDISSFNKYPIVFSLRNFQNNREEQYKSLEEFATQSILLEANTTVLFSIDWKMIDEISNPENILIKITLNNYKRAE